MRLYEYTINISVFLKVSTSHIKSLSSRDFQLSVNSVTFSVFSCEEPLTSVFMGGKTQNLRKVGNVCGGESIM